MIIVIHVAKNLRQIILKIKNNEILFLNSYKKKINEHVYLIDHKNDDCNDNQPFLLL